MSFFWDALERKGDGPLVFPDFMLGRQTKSGVTINYKTALQVATVLACVRVLAEGVSQVPLKLFRPRANGNGSDPATDHPLYRLLYRKPNSWQTSFEFRETLMCHLALCTNAYVYLSRARGEIVEFIPLEPGSVQVDRARDLSLSYRYSPPGASLPIVYPQNDIWHLRGPSWNSWFGMEGVQLAREAIGLAMVLEASQASFHKNGLQTSGLYSVEGNLDEVQHKRLTKWIEEQSGPDNAGKPLLLDRAAKWLTQQMTGVDSQHLETRKHQIEEIARGMRVFPQMIGHAGDQSMTFASAEQFFTAHVVHSLGPWYERIEQSIDVNLLADDKDGVYAKHNVTSLLRGDSTSRADFYQKALGGARPETAWMVRNEVRDLEEMNPLAGGDDFPQPDEKPPSRK